jgi:hypothetical protein
MSHTARLALAVGGAVRARGGGRDAAVHLLTYGLEITWAWSFT